MSALMSHNDWQSVRFLLRTDEFLMQHSFPLEHVQSLLTGKTPELGPNNSPETEQSRKHDVVQQHHHKVLHQFKVFTIRDASSAAGSFEFVHHKQPEYFTAC